MGEDTFTNTSKGFVMSKHVLALALALLSGVSGAQAQAPDPIRGAGASFPAEVYTAWAKGYMTEKKVMLQYQSVGSGEGVKQMVARQVDFGASDDPMRPEELQKNGLMQFPTLIGGLVPVVNLKGVKSGDLRLNGPVLAKIFSGQIKMWNAPEIAELNRLLTLPARPIQRIVREDASGGTRSFTAYLAMHDSGWEKRSGVDFKVNWVGEHLTAKGTKGIVERLKATEGGITYVSYQEVSREGLAASQLQNKDGNFVMPNEKSFLSAVAFSGMSRSGDDTVSLLDLRGAETWPLTETTYVLLPKVMNNGQRAKQVLNFFYWVFAQGDKMAADTGFVPLPTRVQLKNLTRFRDVVGPDGKPVEYLSGQPTLHALLPGASTSPTF
jgi:phosphate transport system substrate-binding protein